MTKMPCLSSLDQQRAVEGCLDGGSPRSRPHGLTCNVTLLLLDLLYHGAQSNHVSLGLLETAGSHEQHAPKNGNNRQIHACNNVSCPYAVSSWGELSRSYSCA